ncbi:CSN12 [Gaeumannomyces tritici R3-111a-1]|uniref:Protein CSN12 homolog n=1 Tax=Gaeumannomyces tritici (strain R3-111a-1) TaxID=644352 RepID=J3P456_GAET3|nr:CSN12 [Gaeumannomyces tritici R3-111a-1]EJT74452.1 CSN12 [Gaeumannomyces tritici R3-111a-1]
MDQLLDRFAEAVRSGNGPLLATTLAPAESAENLQKLQAIWNSASPQDVKGVIRNRIRKKVGSHLSNDEVQGWTEVFTAFWKAVGEILSINGLSGAQTKPSWSGVYEAWKELNSMIIRGYTNHGFLAWTIPCLYVAGKYLRLFAVKADEERSRTSSDANNTTFEDDFETESDKNKQLEDCARQLNRIFTLCLSDRAPLEDSRKWGIYYIINLLFKTYFKLNSASLSRNILKALNAYKGDMPALVQFPKSQQVTFRYYEGVLSFLDENYVEAETHLEQAYTLCHKDALKNKQLILMYLIPCRLLTSHTLPSPALLEPYARLQELFLPLSRCIKKGELHSFDLALQAGEETFVKRRIYLTLERGRDVALRNLLRKVFLVGGFEESKDSSAAPIRRTRVPVAEFSAAISLNSQHSLDSDEVECLLANMIYKNLMKGYIHRERGIAVLSKTGAFPGTGV